MERLSRALEVLTSGEALSFSGAGLLVALLLLGALRIGLPPSEREKIRVPFGFLVAHVVLVILGASMSPDDGLYRATRVGALLLLLVCIGRCGFLVLVDSILVRRLSRPIPKIFRDIMEGLVYTIAVLVALRHAGAQIDALLTTSALLTAVVGLSLQDTLGNLFAGLSIQAQNPFEVGDWIQYDEDSQVVGQVIEINWRATKVLTLDKVEIVIPNGPLARAPLRNFTKPHGYSRRSIFIVIPFDYSPDRVRTVVVGSLASIAGVRSVPEPSVVTSGFEERGIKYWIRYFISDFDRRELIDGMVRDRVWYALRRAGIGMAVPVLDVDVSHDNESTRQLSRAEGLRRRVEALSNVDFCRVLPDAELEKLAGLARERPYAPGEYVVRQGEQGEDFFIVQHGEVAIVFDGSAGEVEVARLESGSFFGEMSVMTGEPRRASVRTVTGAQLLVVDTAAFRVILDANPQLTEAIGEVLADRQEQLDAASSKSRTPTVRTEPIEERTMLLHRIKEFFSLSQ